MIALNVKVPAALDLRMRAYLRKRDGGLRHGAIRDAVETAIQHWLDTVDGTAISLPERLRSTQLERDQLRATLDEVGRLLGGGR